jgi:hypothetical protein
MAPAATGLLRWHFEAGFLRQWSSAPALLGGDPAVEGLVAGAEGQGLALALLGGGFGGCGARRWRRRVRLHRQRGSAFAAVWLL